MVGCDNKYKAYGYYVYETKLELNQLTLKNKGKRFIRFQDGTLFEYTFGNDEYSGLFWGPIKYELGGMIQFYDHKNQYMAIIKFKNVTHQFINLSFYQVQWKKEDYFKGEIYNKNKK